MAEKNEQLYIEGFPETDTANAGRIEALSRTMRRNMTPEERKLWTRFFRQLSVPAVRQKVIGNYIADFFVPPALIIELDGSQHYSEKGRLADAERDAELKRLGFTVLRYSNADVRRNFEGVCEDIMTHMDIEL